LIVNSHIFLFLIRVIKLVQAHVTASSFMIRFNLVKLLQALISLFAYSCSDFWFNSEHLNIRFYCWANVLNEILLYSFLSSWYCCVAFLSEIFWIKLDDAVSKIKLNKAFNCFFFSIQIMCLAASLTENSRISSMRIFHRSIIFICLFNFRFYNDQSDNSFNELIFVAFASTSMINILLLLLIHTRCDIVLRRLMRKILYISQKEKFSRERKTLLL
jgi:hypothetical protein